MQGYKATVEVCSMMGLQSRIRAMSVSAGLRARAGKLQALLTCIMGIFDLPSVYKQVTRPRVGSANSMGGW